MTDVFEEVEMLIDDWHYGVGESHKFTLCDWLGLSVDEYQEYVDWGKLPTNWTRPAWTK